MKYLEAIINEALRLYSPVSSVLPRIATDDLVINDYLIPKGIH
jgi:cytochrome P450